MTRTDLVKQIVEPTLSHIVDLFSTKGDEYGLTGAFHNFEEAVILDPDTSDPIDALKGMKLKHDVSLRDIVKQYQQDYQLSANRQHCDNPHAKPPSLDKLNEKVDDILVYTILLKAIIADFYNLTEKQNNGK